MTRCAKCGAELIGSRKFCAACGTPAVDPATLKRDASAAAPPSASVPGTPSRPTATGPYGPASSVNPFATTASPSSSNNLSVGSAGKASSPYGPPPAPVAVSQVSPLAVSNALSQRGAFQQVAGEAAGETGEVGPVGSNDGAPLGGSASPATCWNAPR